MSDISALSCNMYCKISCQPNSAVMKPSYKKWNFFSCGLLGGEIKFALNYFVHKFLHT